MSSHGRPPPQSDLPSQQVPESTPYYPAARPYNIVPANVQPGSPPTDSFVVSTFDARQIGCFDFNAAPLSTLVLSDEGFPTIARFEYVVPIGYVAILRRISINASVVNRVGETPAALTDIYGMPTLVGEMTLSAYVNGSGVEGLSRIFISEAISGTPNLDCYVLIDEQNTLRLDLEILDSQLQFAGDLGAYVGLYGNLLTQTGRPTLSEPASREPVPTTPTQPGPLIA